MANWGLSNPVSQFQRLEVHDHGVARAGSCWGRRGRIRSTPPTPGFWCAPVAAFLVTWRSPHMCVSVSRCPLLEEPVTLPRDELILSYLHRQ